MGGMKDEAKRITIPPLFPRAHVNDTVRGDLSQPFDVKTMSLIFKCSPTNISNASLIDGHEKNDLSPIYNTSPTTKFDGMMNNPSPRGSLVTTNTKPSSIKQKEYHFKNLPNLDSLKVPLIRHSETDPQANTDLSLQFCSDKAAGSNDPLSNIPSRDIVLSDENKNESLSVMKTDQLYTRNKDGFNNETPKKPKTLPSCERDVSDCSAIIDSLSGMSASSSYDVIRVIGEKRFWKMRTYMINQQKIFTGQVFELYRLITVQKMVAKSPNLLLEIKLINGNKHSTMRSSHLLEMATTKVKKQNTEESYPEHMKPKVPLPSITKELMTPIWSQQLLPPNGRNQWLVPVISPSEGLVYKPYTGPCPPSSSSAFMVPFYGQDSLSTQFSHNYFPHSNARKTFDSMTNPFGQYHQRLSSTSSSHMTQAIPFSLKKSQESDDSEVHGSTASSPPEKHKFEVLPLFPTEPTHQTDDYRQKPMLHAIKAIPHNQTSASESAARIFRSIQEERKDSDHTIS